VPEITLVAVPERENESGYRYCWVRAVADTNTEQISAALTSHIARARSSVAMTGAGLRIGSTAEAQIPYNRQP
jgi:hypothetical protein